MKDSLQQHREKASQLSLGLSHTKIYQKAIELLNTVGPLQRHLDFGSGQGRFLLELKNEFKSTQFSGVDLMPKPKDLTEVDWKQADLNSELPFMDAEFSSITALEIIEHLENPRHVLRELMRVLNPGGHLILSTPNNESWRALISYLRRGHFVAFTDRDYPAHITALNRKDLVRAATEAGFEFVGFSFSELGCLPGVTRLSWQGLTGGLLKGLRYSDNLFISLQKPET